MEVKQELMVDNITPHIEVLEVGKDDEDKKLTRDYRTSIGAPGSAGGGGHKRTASVTMPYGDSRVKQGALPRRRPVLNAKERAVFLHSHSCLPCFVFGLLN